MCQRSRARRQARAYCPPAPNCVVMAPRPQLQVPTPTQNPKASPTDEENIRSPSDRVVEPSEAKRDARLQSVLGHSNFESKIPEIKAQLGLKSLDAPSDVNLEVTSLSEGSGYRHQLSFDVPSSEHTPSFTVLRYDLECSGEKFRGLRSTQSKVNCGGRLVSITMEKDLHIQVERRGGRDYYKVFTGKDFVGGVKFGTNRGSFGHLTDAAASSPLIVYNPKADPTRKANVELAENTSHALPPAPPIDTSPVSTEATLPGPQSLSQAPNRPNYGDSNSATTPNPGVSPGPAPGLAPDLALEPALPPSPIPSSFRPSNSEPPLLAAALSSSPNLPRRSVGNATPGLAQTETFTPPPASSAPPIEPPTPTNLRAQREDQKTQESNGIPSPTLPEVPPAPSNQVTTSEAHRKKPPEPEIKPPEDRERPQLARTPNLPPAPSRPPQVAELPPKQTEQRREEEERKKEEDFERQEAQLAREREQLEKKGKHLAEERQEIEQKLSALATDGDPKKVPMVQFALSRLRGAQAQLSSFTGGESHRATELLPKKKTILGEKPADDPVELQVYEFVKDSGRAGIGEWVHSFTGSDLGSAALPEVKALQRTSDKQLKMAQEMRAFERKMQELAASRKAAAETPRVQRLEGMSGTRSGSSD